MLMFPHTFRFGSNSYRSWRLYGYVMEPRGWVLKSSGTLAGLPNTEVPILHFLELFIPCYRKYAYSFSPCGHTANNSVATIDVFSIEVRLPDSSMARACELELSLGDTS